MGAAEIPVQIDRRAIVGAGEGVLSLRGEEGSSEPPIALEARVAQGRDHVLGIVDVPRRNDHVEVVVFLSRETAHRGRAPA